ncbi:transposase, partial [Streptacidiphilus sp. EB129]
GLPPNRWTSRTLDLVDSEEEMAPMVHKYYSAEFRADAVALYCSDPSLTYAQVARDLGMHAESLRQWVRAAGAAPGPDGLLPGGTGPGAAAAPTTPEERIARLEAENAALRTENTGLRKDREILAVERDILRKATKYFAAETNW